MLLSLTPHALVFDAGLNSAQREQNIPSSLTSIQGNLSLHFPNPKHRHDSTSPRLLDRLPLLDDEDSLALLSLAAVGVDGDTIPPNSDV